MIAIWACPSQLKHDRDDHLHGERVLVSVEPKLGLMVVVASDVGVGASVGQTGKQADRRADRIHMCILLGLWGP